MTEFILIVISALVGVGVGWWLKGRFGAKVAAVVSAVDK